MAQSQHLTLVESSNAKTKAFIIVGGGVFGLSTVLWLLARHPDCTIILIDPTEFSNPKAASHDISKILRDDYPNMSYAPLAIEAMNHWRTDGLFKDFYHEVGVLRADPGSHNEKAQSTHRSLGHESGATWMAPDKVRTAWPAFATTDFQGLDRVRYNPNCGWVDAADSLEAVRQHVVNAGATLVVGEVTTLLFDTAGGCTGVRLGNGDELNGTVVLCTGARTAALLAESAPERKDIHAAHRLAATGAVSFTLKAEGDQKDKFRGIPALKNTLPSVKGESMSMTPDGTLKFNCDMAFSYNQFHAPTGTTMSLAPTVPHLTEWTTEEHIPRHLKDRAYETLKGLYGDEMEGRTIDKYRICWDTTTPEHDFLITPHSQCRHLFIATGGSFHGWKFFPVIGKYVVQMLYGELEPQYAAIWGWDRKAGGQVANATYSTEGDLGEWIREDEKQ
ncbi:FAD dependent oxidoreductase [Colletotrichum graminicola M1.001]|uniref:FAD dependent oxidoreductase n=1 Tax=Colletotrichum graminicola (strain M1.001 / M2 / FGSC 10212) TaxID=645133 RepID=E3QH62_COLGM|nr:FAD dependent oxidoreductase [Colletotrichum graminicola M1.001]EFQ30224.1 FAD dependent oxidoreductase [Colletotrichum graminicola M1.001]